MRISNALQTNAVTLDDEWCEFFRRQWLPDRRQPRWPALMCTIITASTKAAIRPSSKRHGRACGCLQKHKAEYNVLTTVHAANEGQGARVYKFLRDEVGTAIHAIHPHRRVRDNDTGYQEGDQRHRTVRSQRRVTGNS